MGVFTTQTLLNSVGVSRNQVIHGAVAINWILKDGAGRVGKMLFARQGKKFDYDLKQLGTGLIIMITKRNPSLITTFALLSYGHVFSSYQEVKSVVLHTLNRARFTVVVDSFLKTGPRFKDAFQDANSYLAIEPALRERYVVTYNPSKGNIYALFKDQAKPDNIFKAAFHANVLLHIIRSSNGNMSSRKRHENNHSVLLPSSADLEAHIAE